MSNKPYIEKLINDCAHLDEVDASERGMIEQLYIAQNSPVKIKGLAVDWKTDRWTLDFFKETMGDLEVPVKRAVNGAMEERIMPLSEYVPYMQQNELNPVKNPFYLNTTFGPSDSLLADYTLPEYFDCFFGNFRAVEDKATLSWIYLAPTNSVTGLHIDTVGSSAWNLVISGKKFWVFYPPEQNQLLYAGQVNPFDPDFDKHKLYEQAEPMVCVQNPGDIIFTPSGWYHAVCNLEMGVSLTENFINSSNIELVKAHCDSLGIPTEEMYEAYLAGQ